MILQYLAQIPFTWLAFLNTVVGNNISLLQLLWYVLFVLIWVSVVGYFYHVHGISFNSY